MLLVVVCALALAVALPFQQWLSQRAAIARTRAEAAASAAQVRSLQRQQQLLSEPSYVEQQAREQLHDTFPGQQLYIVLAPPHAAAVTVRRHGHASVPASPTAPWYGRLWASDTSAGA
jgi:cell division protein FtsL